MLVEMNRSNGPLVPTYPFEAMVQSSFDLSSGICWFKGAVGPPSTPAPPTVPSVPPELQLALQGLAAKLQPPQLLLNASLGRALGAWPPSRCNWRACSPLGVAGNPTNFNNKGKVNPAFLGVTKFARDSKKTRSRNSETGGLPSLIGEQGLKKGHTTDRLVSQSKVHPI